MKLTAWKLKLGLVLILSSALVYAAQLAIFHKPEDTYFYMMQDLAFLPVQVLLVTMILDQLFKRRERLEMRKKMNMVIGAFFTELGTPLVRRFMEFDSTDGAFHGALKLRTDWKDADFTAARTAVQSHKFTMDARLGDLAGLKEFTDEKRMFLMGLLENPNLLEHESFTELLWALTHLSQELASRHDLKTLPQTDYVHLGNDIRRAYVLLLSEWLGYNSHLQEDYPYIYSLVVRTNPFDTDARVEIMQ